MATVGRAIVQAQRQDALAAAPCDACGHRADAHHLLARETLAVVEGALVATPNPDYRPLDFHCDADGCACVIRP